MGFLQAIILMCMVGETVSDYELNFPSFNVAKVVNFSVFGGASLSSSGLEVMPDASSDLSSLSNKSGRVLYNEKFPLYGTGAYTSISTSFVFKINQTGQGGGEGLAFVITSEISMLDNSSGEWLGLFNNSTNGMHPSKVLAVEFDTKMSPGTTDPNDNHVGINHFDINSILLNSLDPYHINLKGGYDIEAQIDYFTYDSMLYMYVANHSDTMPTQPSLVYGIDLSKILADQGAYFSFSASMSNATELHTIKSWNITFQSGFAYSSTGSSNPHVPSTLLLCIAILVLFIVYIV